MNDASRFFAPWCTAKWGFDEAAEFIVPFREGETVATVNRRIMGFLRHFNHEVTLHLLKEEPNIGDPQMHLELAKEGFRKLDASVQELSEATLGPRLARDEAHHEGKNLRALLLFILGFRSRIGITALFGLCRNELLPEIDSEATEVENFGEYVNSQAESLMDAVAAESNLGTEQRFHQAVLEVARTLHQRSLWITPAHVAVAAARTPALEAQLQEVHRNQKELMERVARQEEQLQQVVDEVTRQLDQLSQLEHHIQGLQSEVQRAPGGHAVALPQPEPPGGHAVALPQPAPGGRAVPSPVNEHLAPPSPEPEGEEDPLGPEPQTGEDAGGDEEEHAMPVAWPRGAGWGQEEEEQGEDSEEKLEQLHAGEDGKAAAAATVPIEAILANMHIQDSCYL